MPPASLKEELQRAGAVWANGRPSHFGSMEEEYALIRTSCGWMQPDFAAIRITGEDRKGWLQGQITNDLREVGPGGSIRFCVLSPTGQIVADCTLWDAEEAYIVTTQAARVAPLLERLQKMLILEDVRIEDLSETHTIVTVQGPLSSDELGAKLELPRLDVGAGEVSGVGLHLLRSDRSGSGGWDILFPSEAQKEVLKLLKGMKPFGAAAWEAARIEAGIPLFEQDMDERTLAMEMGTHFIETRIHFGKGCYTGQEIVERIHSRGHANKKWIGLICEAPVSIGDEVGEGGKVTSTAMSPEFGPIAASMVRVPKDKKQRASEIHMSVQVGNTHAELIEFPILTNAL